MSDDIDIADAVATTLNAATLSQSFTASRSYVPYVGTEDLQVASDPFVTVIPATLEGAIMDRSNRMDVEYQVDVGIRKFIGDGTLTNAQINERCDPLRTLAQEMIDLFIGEALAGTDARCVEVRNVPIFDPKLIDEHRIFATVISLIFRMTRP